MIRRWWVLLGVALALAAWIFLIVLPHRSGDDRFDTLPSHAKTNLRRLVDADPATAEGVRALAGNMHWKHNYNQYIFVVEDIPGGWRAVATPERASALACGSWWRSLYFFDFSRWSYPTYRVVRGGSVETEPPAAPQP